MEMKVVLSGFGVAIPKVGIGANAVSGSYLKIRFNKNQKAILLGISDTISFASESSTVLIAMVETDWFQINQSKAAWVADTNSLIGKIAEIEISGTIVVSGSADLKFTVVDKFNDRKELISKVGIKSSGFMISHARVRGTLRQANLK